MEKNRNYRRKEQTKKKIYDAAVLLFLKKGFDRTTVEEITEAADVAKGTFFNYFPTKDAILSYIGELRVALIEERIKGNINKATDAHEKLLIIFRVLARVNREEEKVITALMIRESTQIPLSKPVSNMKAQQQLKRIFQNVVDRGKIEGQFRQDIDVEQIADLLISLYYNTLIRWLNMENVSMEKEYSRGLEIIFHGINKENATGGYSMSTNHYDVVVVGGGLAGLSAAAFLAHQGKKVIVVERGKLGGRAVTMTIKGFHFNFGAHAIYGRDSSYLQRLEKELDLNINWREFEPTKAKYDIGSDLTDVPVNVQGLFRTKLLKGADKVKFTFQILKTLTRLEKGSAHLSIKSWLEEKEVSEDVQDMMLTLAGSNFFTSEPEKIPSDVFFTYYQRLFASNKPVSYIGGGWQSIIDEFVRVIEQNNGEICTKFKVQEVITEENQVLGIKSSENEIYGDQFLFCIPPKELEKIFAESKIENVIKQYATYEPSYVFVYDIGLKTRLDVPYTYIYDKQNKIFITDISYYDESCVPEGGQLLQAIAYLKKGDEANKIQKNIEALYDKHFPGWKDELVVPRIAKRAVAQDLKWMMHQQPMPHYFPEYRNLFFAGDWCAGRGQLSELSFSSAYDSSQLILGKRILK